MAARAAGLAYEELVERMCELAVSRHGEGRMNPAGARGTPGATAAAAAPTGQ
jgi:hypothetical protein